MSVTLWLHIGMCRYSCDGGLLLCWCPHTAALDSSVSFQGCAVFSEHVSILYKRMQCWRCKHCDKQAGWAARGDTEGWSKGLQIHRRTAKNSESLTDCANRVELLGKIQKGWSEGLQLHRSADKNSQTTKYTYVPTPYNVLHNHCYISSCKPDLLRYLHTAATFCTLNY